jgi:hypothetical protein
MKSMVDVFQSRLFETTSLTAAINKVPYVPQVIGSMGLFEEEGVTDITVFIERQGSVISLIAAKERGAEGTPIEGDKRDAIPFKIPHLPAKGIVRPDEVQGVRQFGTPDQMVSLESVRDGKLTKMSLALDLTQEYHRLGAMQGKVYDADGKKVLVDLYKAFDIQARAEVEFDFAAKYDPNDPAKSGIIRAQLTAIRRDMTKDLEMGPQQVSTMGALCGDNFWDKITNHPEIRETYLAQQEAADLRKGDTLEVFRYGNCDFMNYRGAGSVAVADDDAKFFPKGIPGLFITRFGPADYFETVNTVGLPKYTKAGLDPSGMNKFITLEAQSNPLNICTRPRTLRAGTVK